MGKIELSKDERRYRITLNDPPLNILDLEMLGELREALRTVENDRALLVIDAAGEKAFSAGAAVHDHIGDRVMTMLRLFHDCFRLLYRTEVITVSVVKGLALGGGCELALGCDLVIASDRAKFGQPEINLGVFPPVSAYQMSRSILPRQGLELLLTGNPIDAATASALGMLNAVFNSTEFDERAEEWLGRLLKQSASSLRLTKRAFRMGMVEDFEARISAIERLYLDDLMTTHDANEGLNAFLEKRAPVWKEG